jgi:hypothetical protein
MVATSINAARGLEALTRVRDLVKECGTEEQMDRLTRIMGGMIPAPNRAPVENAVYISEALAILFEMVAEIKEAQKSRPRGRPPKAPKREAS